MSTLRNLREWFQLHEAADYLAEATGDETTLADVVTLALDRHLALALNLPAPVSATRVESATFRKGGQETIVGLFDLPILQSATAELERIRHEVSFLPHVSAEGLPGVIVEREGQLWELPTTPSRLGLFPKPARCMPEEAVICVRRSVLEAFVAMLPPSSAKPVVNQPNVLDKPLLERERVVLLRIIRALAKAADIDITHATKAAEAIAAMIDQDGDEAVASTTIAGHLRKIKDGL